jgi:hypothetical protein
MQAADSSPSPLYHSLLFWLAWVVMSALAATGGWLISGLVGFGTLLIGLIFAGAIVGACLGAAQGWLLHAFTPHKLLPVWSSWLLTTTLGGGVGLLLLPVLLGSFSLFAPMQASVPRWLLLVPPGIGVALLALLQWVTLREIVSQALWWIPVNWLAWGAGIYVAAVTIWPLYEQVSAHDDGPGLPAPPSTPPQ